MMLAMSLEDSQRPPFAPPPSSLFSREGTLYYFPNSGPNPRHYLPLTSFKKFALTGAGSGDDGDWAIP